ncbi:hypothetical protein niasHT_026304 [Heterodera trifolii]|uniref:Nucleotide-diphospho-sugar transferase domain-containing protein n=1 Tax=Heterodera trifolii TaxID=157864 RepID=A0ABD2JVU4_9BILA
MADFVKPFRKAIERVGTDPPAIVLLNKFALNITLNFVCNLRLFPGASDRLIAVVFDHTSEETLLNSFPHLNVIHWPLLALADKFGPGDGRYQLFQYFRAKLAVFLTELVPSFWMVQADTIWRENLFELIDVDNGTNEYGRADLIFDSEGSDGLLSSMVRPHGILKFLNFSDRRRLFLRPLICPKSPFFRLCLPLFAESLRY